MSAIHIRIGGRPRAAVPPGTAISIFCGVFGPV
jgi:hypothetical protein